MAGELKENSAWVPLTPSKSDDIINPDVGYVEKPQFPRIHGNGKEGSVDCAEFMVDGNRGITIICAYFSLHNVCFA